MPDYPILNKIYSPSDLTGLSGAEITTLAGEIRSFLISNVSATGGHLASNLGVVELTLALHLEYDTSRDRVVYDVGHQSYVHKLLTGRRDDFPELRKFRGMSGFPRPSESPHDAFIAGHASTSISAATGLARARTLTGGDYAVAAVIGDGALSGGMAYEALNDAGRSGEPLVVILNDNDMSIAKSVGALAQYLSRLRVRPSYSRLKQAVKRALAHIPGGAALTRAAHDVKRRIKYFLLPGTLFEDMGFLYAGPVDGHDIEGVRRLIRYAREQNCPALIHLKTVKGRGYRPSQERPDEFHGTPGFDMATGRPRKTAGAGFSDVFGAELCAIAKNNPRVCAVTAAMPHGTGLLEFSNRFPERFVDVGIAEEHAVTMAAGMAKGGMIPVCAIYSTFLQRAYDQIIHDVAIDPLHVVFAVDRAGITGEDGETHQGLFDAAFLCGIPGMRVLCPSNGRELRQALRRAVLRETGPVAVRYPRGEASAAGEPLSGENHMASAASAIRRDPDAAVTLVSYGVMINQAVRAAEILSKHGVACEVIKLNEIKPLPLYLVLDSAGRTGFVAVVEDSVSEGSVGQRLACAVGRRAQTLLLNAGDAFLGSGTVAELLKHLGLDADSVAQAVLAALSERRGKNAF